ncbi:FBD-associated F-box protein At5g22730-like [Trifolium pratense]|nr:FBD-associated F-box protein At5g22730-like [Trifolium pratense]XP_045808369.1 FBD-associated F-box protein At5g22730-like [Trifolium pratense]XP_045808370.1 FBD-associated F-box protein At5g22730-like [Trifolium pratense]
MEGGSSKIHNSGQIASVGQEQDMINNKLPELLINRILSLLPTKDAVRTCVLSKRWMNRWTSITQLDINDSDLSYNYNPICSYCQNICIDYCYEYDKYNMTICSECHFHYNHQLTMQDANIYKRHVDIDQESGMKIESGKKEQRFVNFVARVLLLTCKSRSMVLERFSLVINNKRDVSLQNTWISSILSGRVKNLRIHSYFYKLPFSPLTSDYLFNCTSLEELELVLHVFSTIKVPTISIHFEHLKFLKLSGIFFNIDSSSDCMTLCLPLLKKFDFKNCNWSSGKDLIVQAPLLEIVSIEQDIEFYNVISHHDPPILSMKFNALNLKEFTYSGCGIAQLIHLFDHNFVSFDSAEITLIKCRQTILATKCLPFLLLLFQQFHQLKSIKFERFVLDLEVLLTKANIPVFSLLSNLELGLVTVELLMDLLHKSPMLKTLVLKGLHNFDKEFLSSAGVPHCLISSLQIVKFEKVNGDKHEIFLAKYFIENGMMMEELGFSIASQRPDKSKVVEEFKEMVYPFKKRSLFIYCFSN